MTSRNSAMYPEVTLSCLREVLALLERVDYGYASPPPAEQSGCSPYEAIGAAQSAIRRAIAQMEGAPS
jgi:hypothetical protein